MNKHSLSWIRIEVHWEQSLLDFFGFRFLSGCFRSTGQCLCRGSLESKANGGIVAIAESAALNHKDVDGLVGRVGPGLGGEGSAVTESAGIEHGGDSLRIFHDLKVYAPAHAFGESGFDTSGLCTGEFFYGCF